MMVFMKSFPSRSLSILTLLQFAKYGTRTSADLRMVKFRFACINNTWHKPNTPYKPLKNSKKDHNDEKLQYSTKYNILLVAEQDIEEAEPTENQNTNVGYLKGEPGEPTDALETEKQPPEADKESGESSENDRFAENLSVSDERLE